ncbi:CHC2 zinc finger domain-containing protein [Faecalibacterium sp. CLA-AA-H233]|uniref:CHC2 zinc finger domain-containing protein n=2 Tax=Faecalibacterium TaxID=216851 RepID=A0ABS8F8W6_9FIRM|nr:CHC2 zinc finger domain-containing protein [Faecalibacterium sp. CLA-AA-H233]MCC2199675.1 CHC2 zinc finger domain-containing protein [Faecalibacterium sp. CLA-AA-H233]
MMCCPFHGDKHPSMKVDSRFHCFACQADGDVIDFVGRLFQLSPYKAVEKLKEDFGMALADGKVRLAPRRPPTVRQQLLDYYRCLQRWRVRYAPQSPTEELHPCFLEDNLESPVPQKKFSQFLLKNAGKYGLTFSKHIEGKYRGFRGVCVHPAFAAA